MKNIKFKNNRSKPKFFMLLWDLVFLRLVAFAGYDLFKPTIFILDYIFINFRTNLTQFYINFSRQNLWVSINS